MLGARTTSNKINSKGAWGYLFAITKTFTAARLELGLKDGESLTHYTTWDDADHAIAKAVLDKYAPKMGPRV